MVTQTSALPPIPVDILLAKHACALARADRGQWLTEDERHALRHNSMWGSDGYPIMKLGKRWMVDSPLSAGLPLQQTKRAAVQAWETSIRILVDLSGLEAYHRLVSESAR